MAEICAVLGVIAYMLMLFLIHIFTLGWCDTGFKCLACCFFNVKLDLQGSTSLPGSHVLFLVLFFG